MADLRTEEEQIEWLKRWWQENGKSIVAGLVIALTGYAGWMGWQGHQQRRMEAAAEIYQQLLLATETSDKAAAGKLAEELRQQYAGTAQAVFASLQLAKEAVAGKDLPRAAELLNWAQTNNRDTAAAPLIALRLAQVQYAQAQHDAGLATLATVKGEAWQAAAAELRGDIELAQGKRDAAKASYAAALQALEASGAQERRSDLEMKLADLTVAGETAVAAPAGEHS